MHWSNCHLNMNQQYANLPLSKSSFLLHIIIDKFYWFYLLMSLGFLSFSPSSLNPPLSQSSLLSWFLMSILTLLKPLKLRWEWAIENVNMNDLLLCLQFFNQHCYRINTYWFLPSCISTASTAMTLFFVCCLFFTLHTFIFFFWTCSAPTHLSVFPPSVPLGEDD